MTQEIIQDRIDGAAAQMESAEQYLSVMDVVQAFADPEMRELFVSTGVSLETMYAETELLLDGATPESVIEEFGYLDLDEDREARIEDILLTFQERRAHQIEWEDLYAWEAWLVNAIAWKACQGVLAFFEKEPISIEDALPMPLSSPSIRMPSIFWILEDRINTNEVMIPVFLPNDDQ